MRVRYDIRRTNDVDAIRTFISNCKRGNDEDGVVAGRSHLACVLSRNLAEELASDDPLALRFFAMLVMVEELRGTRASRTRNALKRSDCLIKTVERLLRQWARRGMEPKDGTETFHFLRGAGRLDLTGEALLLEFRERFEQVDMQAIVEARQRLAHFGYVPAVTLCDELKAHVAAQRDSLTAVIKTFAPSWASVNSLARHSQGR